jgi:hypothetical protein
MEMVRATGTTDAEVAPDLQINDARRGDGPGAPTRVTLIAGEERWNGSPGDLFLIPESRHAVEAVEDSAVLLTVAKRA